MKYIYGVLKQTMVVRTGGLRSSTVSLYLKRT